MSGRPVPWASWNEWHLLRDDLWSSNPIRQETGLQQVCAWRLRGKLPLGVDATAHLMDARRADEEWQRAVGWAMATATARPSDSTAADAAVAAGELPLRLRYSLPLIRLVNGISDSQQRGRVASSVAVLSDAAGLPRALVDVRHEATHNDLPSLPLLRAATDSALAWLRDNYWDGQSRALAAAAERITSLLACLADSWRAAMAAGMSGSGGALAAGAGEEDEEEEDQDGEAAGGSYSGAEGQRMRRQAMSELRSFIAPAFTHELLQPVLDCPVLLPPELPQALPVMAVQQKQQVEEMAWRSVMKQLLKWYPRLRPLLLQAALRRLVAAVPSSSPSLRPAPPPGLPGQTEEARAAADQRARASMRWVLRLLPTTAMVAPPSTASQAARFDSPGRKQQQRATTGGSKAYKKATAAHTGRGQPAGTFDGSGGAGDSGGEPSLDGPLAPHQLQELLALAMEGLEAAGGQGAEAAGEDSGFRRAAVVEGRLTGPAASEQGAGAGLGARPPWEGAAGLQVQCVQEVIAALTRAIAVAGSGRGAKRAKAARADAVEEVAGKSTADEDGGPGCGDGDDGAGPDGAERQPEQQQQQQQQARRRRWQRCDEWTRCAIGCLPCPLNPNGRIPPLVPPPARHGAPAAGPEGIISAVGALYDVTTVRVEPGPSTMEAEYYMEAPGAGCLAPQGEFDVQGDRLLGAEQGEAEEDSIGAPPAGVVVGGLFGALLQRQGASESLGGGVGFML